MYADDLLLISSTCSDLRRMLRTVFSKPTIPSLLIPLYFSDTGIPRIPTLTDLSATINRRNCSAMQSQSPLRYTDTVYVFSQFRVTSLMEFLCQAKKFIHSFISAVGAPLFTLKLTLIHVMENDRLVQLLEL